MSDALPHETLAALAAYRAGATPQAAALIEGGRSISCAELDAMGRRAAAWLRAQAIGAGDRVALWFVNRPEWLALLFGLSPRRIDCTALRTGFMPPRARSLPPCLRTAVTTEPSWRPQPRLLDNAAELHGSSR